MAFISTGLRLISQAGLVDGKAIWSYMSSDAHSDVDAAGYFARCGAGSRTPSSLSHSTGYLQLANVGMKLNDLVCVQESSNGASPGRVTWAAVIASTADQASTLAATGFATGYNVTISGT